MFDYDDNKVYTIVNPRVHLDDRAFYSDRQSSLEGCYTNTNHCKNLKAIKARRKKNKNKKTHRR